MQSLIDKIERENPLSTDMEENWRYVWPRRWALLNAMVENFNSAQQLKAEILPLLTDALEEFADRKFDNGKYYIEQAMAKLSAV